ncbi:hypothetical protein [Paucibacter soli]|uniref:hypothetical protein n=1 Tax=Paucibacter soli TaxID=3133433 RepID=UPI0030A8CF59
MSVITLKHITDFANLDEADVPGLVAHFPGVIDFIRGQVSALTPGQAGADVVESIIIQTGTPHGLVMQIPSSSSPAMVSPSHVPDHSPTRAVVKECNAINEPRARRPVLGRSEVDGDLRHPAL